jgi:hypothetical protein
MSYHSDTLLWFRVDQSINVTSLRHIIMIPCRPVYKCRITQTHCYDSDFNFRTIFVTVNQLKNACTLIQWYFLWYKCRYQAKCACRVNLSLYMCIWALWEITEEAGNFIFDPSDTLSIHIQQDNISVSQQKMHTLFAFTLLFCLTVAFIQRTSNNISQCGDLIVVRFMKIYPLSFLDSGVFFTL